TVCPAACACWSARRRPCGWSRRPLPEGFQTGLHDPPPKGGGDQTTPAGPRIRGPVPLPSERSKPATPRAWQTGKHTFTLRKDRLRGGSGRKVRLTPTATLRGRGKLRPGPGCQKSSFTKALKVIGGDSAWLTPGRG